MSKLHVFLAAADSEETPLPAIRAEYNTVSQIFETETSKPTSNLNLKNDLNFKVDSLVSNIRAFRDTLHVFHFAGHANGDALLIYDKVTDGESISNLLRKAPKLKLVFLNACATKGHISELLNDSSIAAIIATSSSIPDDLASTFSQFFYEDFVTNKRSLIDSFDTAVKSVKIYNTKIDIGTRDTGDSFSTDSKEAVPWGLYFNPKYDQDEIKEWTLGKYYEFSPATNPNLARNPFIVGPPIKVSDAFFNRYHIVENLKDIQNRQICIIGVRRIGKTSLLHQIANAYQKPQQRIPIMVSLHQGLDISAMGRLLYRNIERASRDYEIPQGFLIGYNGASFLEVLSDWGNFCESHGVESLILIDEADQLSLLGREGLTMFNLIFAVECPSLSIIITGSRFLATLKTQTGTFLAQFERKPLEVLPLEDSHALITQRTILNVSNKNLETISRVSGNHPYLCQYIASALYDDGRLHELEPDHEALVLKDDLAAVLEDEYRRLSMLEKQVMRLLEFEKARSLDELNRRIPIPRPQLEGIVWELKDLSFVRVQQGQCTLGNIFWEKYLQTLPLEEGTTHVIPPTVLPVDPPQSKKNSIFISYHHSDANVFNKLRIHLNPRILNIQDSNSLTIGDEIANSLESQIDQAQTILLLLSAIYIADDEKAREREAIKVLKEKGKRIIPVLISACDWELEFGSVVILPRDKKPIDEKANQDKILFEVTQEIKKTL